MDLQKVFEALDKSMGLNDYLIAQFCTNLEALELCLPNLYARFCTYRAKEPFYFFEDKDGSYNIVFKDTNTRLYPSNPKEYTALNINAFIKNSAPIKYRFYNQYDYFGSIHFKYANETADILDKANSQRFTLEKLKHMPVCTMYGCGLGYHIGDLFSKVEIANLVLIETNPDLFYASLFTFDWSSFLKFMQENKNGIKIIIDDDIDRIVSEYKSFYIRFGKFLSNYYVPFAFKSSPLHAKIHDAVLKTIRDDMFGLSFVDDHLFAISHASDVISKKRNLFARDKQLQDNIKDIPVFVIANGPSLMQDVAFLQKNQDKALIVACGTALDTLYNLGIKPDFYAITERTCDILPTIEIFNRDGFLDDIVLLASEVVHPKIAALFKRHIIFNKANETILWLFLQKKEYIDFAMRWKSVVLMNPLVANFGLSSVLSMGFLHVYLFGMDNGKAIENESSTQDTSTHAKASIVYKDNLGDKDGHEFNSIKGLDIVGEGNFCKKVLTNHNYKTCAKYLAQAITCYKEDDGLLCNVINCSNGLRIDNTKPCHSDSLDFTDNKDIDKKKTIDAIFSCTFVPSFTIDDIKALLNKDVYKEIVDSICSLLEVRPLSRTSMCISMQDICLYIHDMHQTVDKIWASMIEGSIESFFVQAMYALYSIEDEKSALDTAYEITTRLRYLLKDSIKLFDLLPYYIQSDHLKLLDNIIGFDHEKSLALRDFKEWILFTDDEIKTLSKKVQVFKKRV